MKGEMKVAPALAASSAWLALKQSVTLTLCPSLAERAAGLQPVPGERHLDGDILGDRRELGAFLHHAVEIGRGDLGRDRARDDVADLGDHVVHRPPGLHDERGVGGDAVEKAGLVELADFGDIGRIDKELHGRPAELLRCGEDIARGFTSSAMSCRRQPDRFTWAVAAR